MATIFFCFGLILVRGGAENLFKGLYSSLDYCLVPSSSALNSSTSIATTWLTDAHALTVNHYHIQ